VIDDVGQMRVQGEGEKSCWAVGRCLRQNEHLRWRFSVGAASAMGDPSGLLLLSLHQPESSALLLSYEILRVWLLRLLGRGPRVQVGACGRAVGFFGGDPDGEGVGEVEADEGF
jgi:hypothetical protein